ncbi:unnamed protein product [Cylicocyclus nassatus]|uniref:CHK kinase-like domain-containing protein n=1 Tax=Cylicocyclus nassatus TaxID=53992 RepID=A0AA36H0G8_CYLNA|nr:unnamed protein product [Cylicocyclus nassatus]
MGPKLYTVGNGFLETHVTWKDIESSLLKDRELKVKFGPNKNVRQVGEGTGFMSRIAVIDADYQKEVDLPQKFAVKIVTLLPSLGMAKSIKERHEQKFTDEEVLDDFAKTSRNNHNREVDIYQAFSKFDNSLSKMPHVYFTQKFTKDNDLKGFIGMEFIENVVVRDISQNMEPDELYEAIDALAYLEAKSLELNDEEKRKVASNPIPVIYPPLIHATAVSKMIQEIYATAPELEPAGKVLETMTAEFVDLELTSALNEELGMQDVFVHGDLWSANLIWTNTANGLSLTGIVDYQLAHFGCPAEDLTRLFISTMSGKDRRKNWERLLEKFYEDLQKYCTGNLPFTLDQLKESYRRMFPIAGVLLLPTFGNVSEENSVKMKDLLKEKKLALLEDMLFFAKRNRDIRPSTNSLVPT